MRVPSISRVVTATTRRPRTGEIEGVDYYFLSQSEFEHWRERGEFLEWAEVHGNYYGTPRSKVMEILESGRDAVLVIDVQGAANVKREMPEARMVFIQPPSMGDLVKRLTERSTETGEELARRLSAAESEMALAKNYDYVVINDTVSRAVGELVDIVGRERGR